MTTRMMDSLEWFNYSLNKTYVHGGDLRPEEVQGDQQEVGGHEIAVPVEAEAEEDRVVVGDMELTRYSMIRDLRRACRYLGVSQACRLKGETT